jgi:hypothetical protein
MYSMCQQGIVLSGKSSRCCGSMVTQNQWCVWGLRPWVQGSCSGCYEVSGGCSCAGCVCECAACMPECMPYCRHKL